MLAFAGTQQLARTLADAFADLPEHQARALATALGIEEGPAPERLVVAAATLSLLAAASEERPLLCAIDDAHWLDHASAEVLTFAARRFHAERIVILFAARVPERAVFTAAGIPELHVTGLAPAAARTLREPELADITAEQLVGLARGNPLALLEVPRVLTDAQRAAARRSTSRSRSVPRSSGRTASARPGSRPTRAVRCHPLARSAGYQLARPAHRRAAHAALATATAESDRRAWHLAAAADGPDEEVARLLEDAAAAGRRGGVAAEVKAFERAAQLTPDPEARARRLLHAAFAAEEAGWLEHAETLLEDAGELTQDAGVRAQAVARRAYLLGDRGEFGRAYALAVYGAGSTIGASASPRRG